MRGISSFANNVSLDAWLFGEEKPSSGAASPSTSSSPAAGAAQANGNARKASAVLPSTAGLRNGGSDGGGGSGRSNSMPVNQLTSRLPRSKKASFAMPGRPPVALANGKPSTNPSSKASSTNNTNSKAQTPSEMPFPVSSKLRKLFQNRPNRLQWNKGRHSLTFGSTATDDSKRQQQQQILGIAAASFERLQGHVPFTLKEIVKDPKKLPYLLQWLSTDDLTLAAQTNYHQVLLFLLEIEQLQLVPEEKRRDQAGKIWNKYIDHGSEFQISTTLELTVELEQLVRDSIDRRDSITALDGFFPIQKLAYMRLTREEMPRFLKSSEYLQMLIDTENDTASVPMERILQVRCWLIVSYITAGVHGILTL